MEKMRVFVASPSDMAAERVRVEVVAAMLKPLADDRSIALEVVDWRSVVPDMGRPEQAILDQLKPTSWDVFIGILWHRFGTPTGGQEIASKQKYLSGTEEEFKTAYQLWQNYERPRIMIYRCTRNIPPGALNPDQFKQVQDFFGQFDVQKGTHPGLYQTFDTIKSFEMLLFNNLQRLLLEHGKNSPKNEEKRNQATKTAKIFISYKRLAKDDRALAEYLSEHLANQGHDVFIDTSMRVGTQWLKEIDEQIKSSDYLIVLVSKDSADSEMVQTEIQRAYEYRQLNRKPHTLPVRMNYVGLLPYTISAFINQYQQITWNNIGDNKRIVDEISRVISSDGSYSLAVPRAVSEPIAFSEDGRAIYSDEERSQPLPGFDPRILDELEDQSGSLKLDDKFYIRRTSDEKLEREICKEGRTITIRASRQTGKSSLLVRGIHKALASANVVYLDLQSVEHSEFTSNEQFLKYLAGFIARKLKMDYSIVERIWQDQLGPQDKLVKVMEEYILPQSDRQIILAIDEADKLLNVPFHSDFFALLRFWHNNRAVDLQWTKLNIVMVIATEPYLLISNPNQSPFNVGTKLNLEDFNHQQVRDLNQRHGNPISENNLETFFELLSGHPYLTRKALYLLVGDHWTWETLYKHAADDTGPFADNLRRQLWFIQEDDVLQSVLRQILHQNKSGNDKAVWRLMRAGLIKGMGDRYSCRCGLYERYFREHLK